MSTALLRRRFRRGRAGRTPEVVRTARRCAISARLTGDMAAGISRGGPAWRRERRGMLY
ncbi:hypothetical protein KCP76_00075 [Salmonella enterica subsp. enterica serovar Weltevreden]|nr:hypothetical protein KCP76_00075 [Salmonella enterica subsp. enterica serovar Weltevreden]